MPKLEPGAAAPEFSLVDQGGKTVKLESFRGEKLVVYFYTAADTPGCTTQSCALRDAQADLRKLGASVVGISPDPPPKQKRFDEKYDLGFPLLADEHHQVATAWGAWGEKSMHGKRYQGIIRSAFVIDERGKVVDAFYKVSPKETVARVTRALEEEEPEPDEEPGEPAERKGPGPRQVLIVLAAVVLGLGVGLGAVAVLRDGGGEPAQEVADRLVVQGPVIDPLVAGQPDEALGQPAPVLQGETLGGEAITTETGRPRMLVFFAHWCVPCEAELGLIVRLAGEDVLDGIDVIGVSTSADPERSNHPPSEWLRDEGWPFPTVADTADGTAARAYAATDLPYFVFIDSAGIIVGRASGEVSAEDLTTIARALATGRLAATTTTTPQP